MSYYGQIPISDFLGKTFTKISNANKGDDEINFVCDDGVRYVMYHEQDCCEGVELEDVAGDIQDLIGSPILEAEVVTNQDDPPREGYNESWTWTFYKLGTIKGHVTLRWLGESNGYYSEEVYIKKVENG